MGCSDECNCDAIMENMAKEIEILKRNNSSNRVVVVGAGVVSPIGNDIKNFKESLFLGKTGIESLSYFNDFEDFEDEKSPVKIAGIVKDFSLDDLITDEIISQKDIKRIPKFTQFGLKAVYQAMKEKDKLLSSLNQYKCGVIMGTGAGGQFEGEQQTLRISQKGISKASPMTIPMRMPNSLSGRIAQSYNIRGANMVISTACSSSANAIGESYLKIKNNELDMVITGGAEAPITPTCIGGFYRIGALSKGDSYDSCCPFSKERDGFIMGEGAGALVLTSLDNAIKYGYENDILAEIIGYGTTNDAIHETAPDEQGKSASIALKDSFFNTEFYDDIVQGKGVFVNAHGTSTPLNDKIETKIIKNVFGIFAKDIPVVSTKSMTGHLIGATSAIELIASICCINENIIHPTINYKTKDPECDLDYVTTGARDYNSLSNQLDLKYAISNSFGFGGHNACLAIKKYEP